MSPDHSCHHEKKNKGIMYTKCTKTVLINIFAKQNKNGGEEPLPDINKNLPDSKEARLLSSSIHGSTVALDFRISNLKIAETETRISRGNHLLMTRKCGYIAELHHRNPCNVKGRAKSRSPFGGETPYEGKRRS